MRAGVSRHLGRALLWRVMAGALRLGPWIIAWDGVVVPLDFRFPSRPLFDSGRRPGVDGSGRPSSQRHPAKAARRGGSRRRASLTVPSTVAFDGCVPPRALVRALRILRILGFKDSGLHKPLFFLSKTPRPPTDGVPVPTDGVRTPDRWGARFTTLKLVVSRG